MAAGASLFFGAALLLSCASPLFGLLPAAFLAGAAGCGFGGTASAQEIYVAAFSGSYGEAFWTEIKEGFEAQFEEEGYTVRVVADPKIEDTIMPQVQGGQGPDVVFLPVGQTSAYTEQLLRTRSVLKLNDLLEENVPGENVKLKEKFMDGMIGNTSTNPYANAPDDTYMLPLFYSPLGLFYNKSKFVAHADPYTPITAEGKYMMPQTWEEFISLGKALDAQGEGTKLFAYPTSSYMREFMFSMLASHGGTESFEKFLAYDQPTIASEAYEDVFRAIGELGAYTNSRSWTETAGNYLRNQQLLLTGEVLFMPCGTWLPTEMGAYDAEAGFEYGFTTPFRLSADDPTTAVSKLEQVFILKSSKKQDIAKKFVSYLFSDEAAEIIINNANGGIVPVKRGLEFAAAEGSDVSAQTLGFFNSIYAAEGLTNVSGTFAPSNTINVDWDSTFTGTIDDLYNGVGTVDEWIGDMYDDAKQLSENLVG